jgi:undecaprenyldiphospho-muramoylpentapeptide beta-N-acetylglucosaminyltransferase
MTGGGVYPALAVLQTMNIDKKNVLWIGSENSMEANLLATQDIQFKAIPAAGMHGVAIKHLPGNILKIFKGYAKSRKVMRDFPPDVIFYTGGFIALPVALAARGVPSVVFIPDIEPGAALNFLIRRGNIITASSERTRDFVPGNKRIEITGYPIRSGLAKWDRESGRKEMGLNNDLPVILIFGGSKGARSINQAVHAILPDLLKVAQVIHISGEEQWESVREYQLQLEGCLSCNYHPYPFLHDQMGAAFASADLAVCRAGASTLGELPFFRLPAILVPYPYSWRYQHTNAEFLVHHGGAILLKDQDLMEHLLNEITCLINDPAKLMKMSSCMQSLAQPDAALKIGNLIREAGKMKGGSTSWSV